uniref:ATP synthase F0 subunit 8 n=1 Tax=Acerentomon microrhinus TaxID=996308 RepID=A0A0C4FSS0_9HEXA|nr:ATP synthase F0 subunit 8 [Acerentomon microrhinus]AFI54919.1 ATP synthase F0 subunit 8 [Acerentomon microrhinus]
MKPIMWLLHYCLIFFIYSILMIMVHYLKFAQFVCVDSSLSPKIYQWSW